MATLVNGNGNLAIYAAQDSDLIAAICGNVTSITQVGNKFDYELLDANTIGLKDGVIITKEGRRIQLDANHIDEFVIPNGQQGTTNYYIIGYKLVTDGESKQTAETFVQLMNDGTETIAEGTFRGGDDSIFVSLYRVEQVNLNINSLTLLLPYSSVLTEINEAKGEATKRWLRFNPDNKKGLIIKAGTLIKSRSGKYLYFPTDQAYDFSTSVTEAGKDYFVFINDNKEVSVSSTPTSATLTKIGRFHTLCVSAGTITMIAPASPSSGITVGDDFLVKPYHEDEDPDFYAFYNKKVTAVTVQSAYDVITCEHPLSGFAAGDILPESVFCINFHPDCLFEDAMVYEKTTDRCVDIYLYSGTNLKTRSEYNKTHTVSRAYYNIQQDFLQVGKRCLYDSEFTAAALGSNERTAIQGAADKTTVGGHVDTANRRMISAIGCEECCGYLWQVLSDVAATGGSGWVTTDTHASFGQEYGDPHVLIAGARWSYGSSCGSRARDSSAVRSATYTANGGRGSSRVYRL